jgi:CubicO group peptidase (beta-lactamase class C family)
MKTALKRTIAVLLILIAAVAVAAGWLAAKALPIGTGYAAKYLCTSVFVSGRAPQAVFEEDVKPVNPLALLVSYRVDRESKTVTADAFGGFESRAVYREGCGCTLAVGTNADELRRQAIAARPIRETALDDLDGPLPAPEAAAALPGGVDPLKLKQALDAAFAEEGPGAPKKTRAVVVVYGGRIVAERYAPGFGPRMPLIGWSMAKSVTNALVGILVRQGKLDLKAPAPVPEWQAEGDPRRAITLDQLMRMSSGLQFEEVYLPLYDATAMLYGSPDFAAYAAAKPLAGPPESVWNYSSGTANIIARIVRQTVEKDSPDAYDFMRRELFDKIGMASALIEPDPSGTFVGSSYAVATPRDWARFGLLFLQDGLWRGERLLPEGWVRYTATPTAMAPRGEYGAMWWLNSGAAADPSDRPWPSAPRDAFAARGFQEQRVIVIPSRQLVLVRFGATSDRKAWNTDGFIADILAALPPGSN